MATRKPLSLQRFGELLEIHGHQLSRWPEPERSSTEPLLVQSAAAREALARAEELAVLLDGVHAPEPTARLKARVLEIPIRHPRSGAVAWWPFATFRRPLLALAAAAALGVLSGAFVPWNSDDLPNADWDEMSALALGSHLDLEQW